MSDTIICEAANIMVHNVRGYLCVSACSASV